VLNMLKVQNFRSLKDVKIPHLGRVNVLVGPGNTGKTNLLEAIFLGCSTGDPGLMPSSIGLRKLDVGNLHDDDVVRLVDFAWTIGTDRRECVIESRWNGQLRRVKYRRDDTGADIALKGQNEQADAASDELLKNARAVFSVVTDVDSASYVGTLVVTPQRIVVRRESNVPNIRARFVGPGQGSSIGDLAPQWTKVEEEGRDKEVRQLLRLLDEEIEDISLAANEQSRAFMTFRHALFGRVPIEMMGAGFAKCVAIALYVLSSKRGILLIDEIDASLHIGAQRRLVEFLLNVAAELDVQLFISTHSLETFDVLLDCFNASPNLWSQPDDLQVLQFSRERSFTQVRLHSATDATELRDSLGVDLRR